MRERQEARQVSQRFDFHTERAQAPLIAWMSGRTPRMAIIRFRLRRAVYGMREYLYPSMR
jgi:hypothetical protein